LHSSYLEAYFNYAYAQQKATNVVSNQFLFNNSTPLPDLGGQTVFQYIATHWVFTDHAHIQTAPTGASFRFIVVRDPVQRRYDLLLRTALRRRQYRSPGALRAVQCRNFPPILDAGRQTVTLGFDVVNLLDTIYELRNGTSIGVFAPQFGPRRGFFFGISKKI
jgi:hypothetical protein